ncbi:MAG: LON peptidase substrate-binding domain-containing protein [Planctomycetota bacterium]|nr:LON peptidase substrate-binding domain-containing protein [Planctomycetota bacterium]
MSDECVPINFERPIPLFPLDQVVLLPLQVLPLHVFEPRYRQMVAGALDGPGFIAMASFEGEAWKQQYHGRPPLRPAVCIGQIIEHERLADGRFAILLQGRCRARIVKELKPEGDRLYRSAMLEPIGLGTPDEKTLAPVRVEIKRLLSSDPLTKLRAARPLSEYIENPSVPTAAVLELVSYAVISDAELRYRLLADGDVESRSRLIFRELRHLGSLVRKAAAQRSEEWPKGCSWN